MNLIVIFGPPGVGKSTLVKLATKRGIRAYDLEDCADKAERKIKVQKILDAKFNGTILIGAANLHPEDFPHEAKFILLLPDRNIYLKRLEKRDKLEPEQRGQGGPAFYDGFAQNKEPYTRIIEDSAEPEEILEKIFSK